jgi:hypothetical protein
MTHIRIRASLGGNIPRMSKILPVPRDTFVFQTITIATSKFRAESFISRLQAELDQPADVSATQGAPKRKAAGRDRRLEAFHCHKPWVTVSPSVRKLSSNSGASRERSPYTRGDTVSRSLWD